MIQTIKKGRHYKISSFSKSQDFNIIFNSRDEEGHIVDGVTMEDYLEVAIKRLEESDRSNGHGANPVMIKHLKQAMELQRQVIKEKIQNKIK